MSSLLFANPQLLWGLLLAAAPLIVHWLFRRRAPIEPWAAMRFVRQALDLERRKMQLRSWLQLLVRVLLITCLVLAAADPRLDADRLVPSSPAPVHRLLVIDSSLSMRARQQGRSRFERALQLAEATMQERRPGDTWQLVQHGIAGDPVVVSVPSSDANAVLAELKTLQPSCQAGSLDDTFTIVLRELELVPVGVPVEVLLYTDMQRSEWLGGELAPRAPAAVCREMARRARITIVDCGGPVDNSAVTELQAPSELVRVGRPVTLQTRVEQFSESAGEVPLQLFVDSLPHSSRTVEIRGGRGESASFVITPAANGEHVAEVRLPGDALAEDDRRWIAFRAIDAIRVLVVRDFGARSDHRAADFVELALDPPDARREPSRPFIVTQIHAEQIRETDLLEFEVVLLDGVSRVSLDDANALSDFVHRGGGLLVTMGNNVDVSAYNHVLGAQGANLLPGTLAGPVVVIDDGSDPFYFVPVDRIHPVIAGFADRPEAGLESSRVYRYVSVAPRTDDARVERVIDLSSGDPLLLFQRVGHGRVGLLSTAFDLDWGPWVIWPSLIPILHETIRHLAQPGLTISVSLVSEPVELPILSTPCQWTAQQRDGAFWQGTAESNLLPAGTQPFTEPGVYDVLSDALPHRRFLVVRNVDSGDSNLERISVAELQQRIFTDAPVRVLSAESPQIGPGPAMVREHSNISRGLSVMAIVLLFADLLLARSLSGAVMLLIASVLGAVAVIIMS